MFARHSTCLEICISVKFVEEEIEVEKQMSCCDLPAPVFAVFLHSILQAKCCENNVKRKNTANIAGIEHSTLLI